VRVPRARLRLPSRPTARLSVRLRATLAATAIVAVALGGASAVLVGVLSGSLQDSAVMEANRRATVTADLLAAGVPPLPPPGGRPSGSVTTIAPDVLVVGDPAAPKALLAVAPGDPAATWAPDGAYAVAVKQVRTTGGEVLVQARASLQPAAAALATLQAVLLPGIPALLLLVAGLTWLAVGRALAPVSAIRRELADITASDLHRRVPIPPARDEITRLAKTTNQTLDRLERAVGRHRRFVADAAHELRSPLAVLRTRLEVAPRQGLTAEALTAEALTDVDRIQRLTADLLLLARLDAGEPPEQLQEVDLGQVAAEEAARTRPRTQVRVELRIGSGLVVRGSGEQLRRLVANLVDNAVRHAHSTVVVRLERRDGDAVLEVTDDGPGIPVEHQEAVFDRFTRLDEARDRDAGGSGLGLAIARDIAAHHGGTLVMAGGPPGAGLRAVLPIG
jgi:signal transduction histidine kinase